MKPRSLALALGTALWGVGLTGLAGPLAGNKPNVLFLMADDLRPELGCYGAGHVISPNIDRLAKRGRMLEYQNDPWENKNVAAEAARRAQVLSRKLAKVHPVKRHPADD